MLTIRKANDRGHGDHGWLNSYHTFSFASYYDPKHMGFRSLRVMNEDRVAPGQGFGTHEHDNMEIVTYVLEGALEHKDSMGNGEILRPGEFQRMSAGMGILHSEFNPSKTESAHFYQIWLLPSQRDIVPSYEQKRFAESEQLDQFRVVASPDGRNGSLKINQDVSIYLGKLSSQASLAYVFEIGRHGWLQVLRGSVKVGDFLLAAGDGLAIKDETSLSLGANETSEVMLFDLA